MKYDNQYLIVKSKTDSLNKDKFNLNDLSLSISNKL